MSLARDTWYTMGRHLRALFLREPVWIFFSMLQPLIWLLLFTQLFNDVALMPGFPTGSYLQFFAPGLIVMMAVFGSAYSGFAMLDDIHHGVLEKMLVTPVNRYALILGAALNFLVGQTIQVLILCGIACLMGLQIATGIGGVLLTIVIVSLLGLGFFGLSNALVIATKKETPLVVISSMMTMPLMFLSSAMMPSQFAAEWIQSTMKFNPVNYAVDAARPLFASTYDWSVILPGLAVLGAFALFGIVIATLAFRKFGE